MLVLGVDIAARKDGTKNCGLALIDGARLTALDAPGDDLIWTQAIDGCDLAEVARVIGEAKVLGAYAADDRPRGVMLAIERQFPGTFSGAGPGTIEKLIGSRVRFETVATIRGVAFELVYPASWQTILSLLGEDVPKKLSKPRKEKAPKRKKGAPAPEVEPAAAPKWIRDTKAAARLLVSRLYPGAVMGPDECDALLLARFVAWRRRGEEKKPEWIASLHGAHAARRGGA